MDRLDLTKKVAGYIVGAGTGRIVAGIIDHNIDTPEKLRQRLEIAGAALVIGMMAKDLTKQYTDAKIDSYAILYKEKVMPFLEKIAQDQ